MAHLITDETITAAWLAALEHLNANGRDQLNLVTTIIAPDPETADAYVIRELDRLLDDHGCQRVETVANTIFPAALVRAGGDREQLYGRYKAMLPRLRKLPKNHRGLYFERLIAFPGPRNGEPVNQLEAIIGDLKRELARSTPLRFIYEAQISAPGKDRRPVGFPCLSYLSFQLEGDRLHLTATYRNQYYFQKALGNFLGLARLHRFVADEVGLRQGSLTIHAFHAQIEIGQRESAALIQACRRPAAAAN
jgi:thymidylate synthase